MQPHLTENWFPQDFFRNESRVMPPADEHQPYESEVYEWQVHGKPISIQMNLDVVDRLKRDLLEFTYSGVEVTGILLGQVVTNGYRSTVIVEGYEAALDNDEVVSFLAKQKHLADIVGKWNGHSRYRPVGLFRSQNRGWLALSDQDLELGSCLFPRLDNIFLVVRSSPGTESKAGFFFWEGNQIQSKESYCEFAFDPRVLGAQSINQFQIVDAQPEMFVGDTPRKSNFFTRNPGATLGLTWGLAIACTLTGLSALGTHVANRAAVDQAPAVQPANFEVEYHGQRIKVNLNHGLPSDLERASGPLSERQRDLLRYVAQDVPKEEIATKLGITTEAVDIHKEALSRKLGVTGEAGLVRYAIKAGLVKP